jgi:hypothetical protein
MDDDDINELTARVGNLAEFGSLCLDSFRGSQMPATEGVGQEPPFPDLISGISMSRHSATRRPALRMPANASGHEA